MTIAQAPRLVSWARDEADPQNRTLRILAIGVGLSLLLHALLIATAPKPQPPDQTPPGPNRGPMQVRLAPPPEPAPPPVAPQITPSRKPPPRAVIAVTKPVPQNPTIPLPPPPPVTPPVRDNPPTSMAEMVERARARQQSQEQVAAAANADARASERAPSPDEKAMASINRNLQTLSGREGGGGVFTVRSRGQRYGEFSFRGWADEYRKNTYQLIEVDAGVGGDVDLALVRRMIVIIRERYQGDFKFESQRLHSTVTLSARPADNAGLEAFMMREFFDFTPQRP